MARPRSEHQIERNADASGGKAGPLQDAQGTRQIAKPELIDEGDRKRCNDGDQPEGVEQSRQFGRHLRFP
jgi:hypothetical protein